MADEVTQQKAQSHPATIKRAAQGSLGARLRLQMDEAEAALARKSDAEK